MNTLVAGLLDNESFFGKLMTKAAIIIGANIMFLFFSLPVITIGPAFAALMYVMLETMHGDGSLNPFKVFWKGFRMNFKQGLLVGLAAMALAAVLYADVRICDQAGGMVHLFRYGAFAIAIMASIILVILMPVMAAFKDSLPHLIRNALYFACKSPFKTLVILFFDVFPLYLTYSDPQFLPLYAFIWCMCGFGAIAYISAWLLYPEFKPLLSKDDDGEVFPDDEAMMIDELRRMDGI